jgi:hypothetical protein
MSTHSSRKDLRRDLVRKLRNFYVPFEYVKSIYEYHWATKYSDSDYTRFYLKKYTNMYKALGRVDEDLDELLKACADFNAFVDGAFPVDSISVYY